MNVARRRAGATRAGSAHCTWIEGAAAVAWVERAARSPGRRVHFTLTRASPGSSPGSAQATATHPGLRSNSRSERRLLTEVLEAVDRRDFYFAHVAVLQDAERDLDACGAASPHLAIELLLRMHRVAADAEDDVADMNPCAIGGALGRDPRHQKPALYFIGGDAEPRPRRPGTAAGFHEVRQDRFQELDRNKHIPRQVWIGSGGIAQDEGADAQQRAVFADQRCAAPVERRRRGEDRPVEE